MLFDNTNYSQTQCTILNYITVLTLRFGSSIAAIYKYIYIHIIYIYLYLYLYIHVYIKWYNSIIFI